MPGRLKLTISYDGTRFHGSQRQQNGRSVQGELEQALFGLTGKAIAVELAGRTDAGVHAIGQVASVEQIRPEMSGDRLSRAINAHLPADVCVLQCEPMPDTFHARYDATWREYRYRIWCGAAQPLARTLAWHRHWGLNAADMDLACRTMIGTHDLASFSGDGSGIPNPKRTLGARGTVRTVFECGVQTVLPWWGTNPDSGTALEIRMVADGFLPQSVRTIAGALVEIGRGKRPVEWMADLLEARDRRQGPQTAPAHGLILWRVGYGDEVPGRGRHERERPVRHTRIGDEK